MPRIVFLTQYFPPEIGAAQTRLFELGQELSDLGWDVEVLTALPNYPTGRVFEGYDLRTPVQESIGRLSVVRVPLRPAQKGFVDRLLCYFSFVRSAIRWGPSLCAKPDVLFIESPPLFIGHAGVRLSRQWDVPMVFNVSDLWPESAKTMGVVKNPLVLAVAEALELSYYRRAVLVTGTADEIVESVRRRCPSTPAEVITNGVDITRFGPQFADDEAGSLLGHQDRISFTYAGVMGIAQGLDLILDVAVTVRDLTQVQFVLVGDGAERESLQRRIESNGLHNIRLLRPQPKERIPALLAVSSVAFHVLKFSILGAVPSKIYEAMASGLPILFAGGGEGARRVQKAGAGLVVPYGDVRGLEKAVRRLASDPALRQKLGSAGRCAAEQLYSRKAIARRLHELLMGVISRSKSTGRNHSSISGLKADEMS
ncbi:MAG: glycosyltransferase family 4 protein [Nitrospira sp.]|nr:glycosyltransferase family 4 protein [Nitrospira sp.]